MNYYVLYGNQIVGRAYNSKQASELAKRLGLPFGTFQIISEFEARRRGLTQRQLQAINDNTNQPF